MLDACLVFVCILSYAESRCRVSWRSTGLSSPAFVIRTSRLGWRRQSSSLNSLFTKKVRCDFPPLSPCANKRLFQFVLQWPLMRRTS